MANENELNDAKLRTWRAAAELLESLGRIAAKLETMADRELADRSPAADPPARSRR